MSNITNSGTISAILIKTHNCYFSYVSHIFCALSYSAPTLPDRSCQSSHLHAPSNQRLEKKTAPWRRPMRLMRGSAPPLKCGVRNGQRKARVCGWARPPPARERSDQSPSQTLSNILPLTRQQKRSHWITRQLLESMTQQIHPIIVISKAPCRHGQRTEREPVPLWRSSKRLVPAVR